MRVLVILVAVFSVFLFTDQNCFAVPVTVSPTYTVEEVASGLHAATGLALSPDGFVYVSDYSDYNQGHIYKVDPWTSYVQTIASGLSYPLDLAFDASGNLYALAEPGSPRTLFQVLPDGSLVPFATGFSYSVGLEYGNDGYFYIGNSGDGTISRVSPFGVSETFLSGYSTPNGPFGVTMDQDGNVYFAEHGTGNVYVRSADGTVTLLASLTDFGVAFVAADSFGTVYVSDPVTASIWSIEDGSVQTFATGFAGKSTPPMIGPLDMEFDGHGNMYVADAGSLWRISGFPVSVPEPSSLILLSVGLIGFAGFRMVFRD